MTASILHADLDAFFASVEQRDDPRLRDRPVIVGGGVVLAASYEARACGVHGGMGGRQAKRLCPDAVVVPPRMQAYVDASKAVFDVFRDTTPVVEGISIDEAFLDVSGLARVAGRPRDIAQRLRAEVRRRVGLPITVGVARTKSLAKVASAEAKPDGLLVVEPGEEEAFLHPLPVERLWGVGPVTAEKLRGMGITTIGDLHRASRTALKHQVGVAVGNKLHALAGNRDPRRVVTRRRRGSIGSQRALGRRTRSPDELDAILVGLVDRVGRRMRAAGRTGRTVVLRLRFGDFTRATRSRTLPISTAHGETLLTVLRGLLAEAMPMIVDRGITLLGITVANLDGGSGRQLELPLFPGSDGSVDEAMDQIWQKYGKESLTRGVLVGRSPGIEMPTPADG